MFSYILEGIKVGTLIHINPHIPLSENESGHQVTIHQADAAPIKVAWRLILR